MFVIAASLHTIMTNSHTYSVLPVFPFDSVWLLDLHPNVQDLKTLSLRYMAFLEGTSMKFSTWNLAMWARIPKKYHSRILQPWRITKSRPWCSSRHTCDSLRVSRILLSLFSIFACATLQLYSTSSTNEVGPPMPTAGANGSVWQFPATNQTIFWGPATHGSIQGQSCLRTDYQTRNVSFKPDFKIKTKRTANLSSKFVGFTKCSQKIF